MFRCDIGRETVGPNIAPVKIVVERRPRTYVDGQMASTGWEIVKEISVCRQHAEEFQAEEDSTST